MSTKEKDTNLLIRISKKEKAHAAQQAAAIGLSLSAYSRALLSGTAIKARADKDAINALVKLGGLLKDLHNKGWAGGTVDPAETWKVLKSIEAAAAKLAG